VKQKEVEDLALIGRTRKGSKKGYKKSMEEESSPCKKDLSDVIYFTCHQKGHYASQCPKKKGKAKLQKQVERSACTVVGVDKLPSQLERLPSPWSLVYHLTPCQMWDSMWIVAHRDI
jgi:hypothetical protein